MTVDGPDPLGWLTDRQRDGGVDRVRLPAGVAGTLWLCGKHAVASRFDTGAWDTIVCLVERHELAGRYPEYLAWLDAAGATPPAGPRAVWHPIPDLHAPPVAEMADLVTRIVAAVENGDRVLVHCAAGKGRAGTAAACVLITFGLPVADALARVAAGRPGAGPEVGVQRELVDDLATHLTGG